MISHDLNVIIIHGDFWIKFEFEVHRTGKFPSGRTTGQDCLKPDTGRTGHYPLIISDDRLFSELSNEDYAKRSRFLPQSGENYFPSSINGF